MKGWLRFHHKDMCQSVWKDNASAPHSRALTFWEAQVIQEMMTDYTSDSPCCFLEIPPSRTTCQEFLHAFVKRHFKTKSASDGFSFYFQIALHAGRSPRAASRLWPLTFTVCSLFIVKKRPRSKFRLFIYFNLKR